MATDPVYEVYALKYGERDTTKCQFFYRESSHDPLTLHRGTWHALCFTGRLRNHRCRSDAGTAESPLR